jgi:chromosome segregation ATPase
MVGVMLVFARAAHGADVSTLQARVDAAHAQARQLAGRVQMQNAEFQAAARAAAAAAARQGQLEAELVNGERQVRRLQAQVRAATRRYQRAQARFHRAQDKLSARLVAIYKSDTPDLASIVLESDGFDDLLTRSAYLKAINSADSALVDRVKALRDRVEEALRLVRVYRARAQAEVDRIRAARDQIASVRTAARARAAQAERARGSAQASLDDLRSRMAGWEAQVAALQQATGQGGNAGDTVNQWFDGFTIPKSIVMCESGGNYKAVNPTSGAGGAYQFMPDTYRRLGGKYGLPQNAPKWEQDKLAAKLWNNGAGAGNWVCAG